MSKYTIFHNPRCSKSRQTLQLLQDNGIEPDIELYLDQPPSEQQLAKLLGLLGISARELLRKGEADYKELGLANTDLAEAELITAMRQKPKLIERPIVVRDGKAAILGRPPENVLQLL